MIIKRMNVGVYGVNCYILMDEETKKAAVIDAGGDANKIYDFIKSNNMDIEYILLTHGHFDHTTGVKSLKELSGAKVVINAHDDEYAQKKIETFGPILDREADIHIEDGDTIELGNTTIECIATPGHTKGGMCFKVEDKIFVGDTLFQASIGRADLPGGNHDTLINSIQTKLMKFDDDTQIYPGHGPATSIGYERRNNPFIG